MEVKEKFDFAVIMTILIISMILFGCVTNQTGKSSSNIQIPVNTGTNQNANNQNINTQNTQAKTYTLSDVSAHSTADSCWMAIDGKVYDVTTFIPNHPGGSAMLAGCGKDASDYYNTKGGRGRPHSSNAQALLQQYYIGDLIN
jgi:cytochrome b involved in lipid metabolism